MQDKPLRLCLAASGGGHVRQLLDLEPAWCDQDYFFVTEDTALGRSLAEKHPVRFVEHYALGQARLGRTADMLKGAARNFAQSLAIVRSERPDVVVTTGAGAVYWTAMGARASGAKVILIDSFARFDAPSKFARALRPFATETIVQSEALKLHWPDARLFDPFRVLDSSPPRKQPLLFATVGATLGFPRLVDAVLKLKASGALPNASYCRSGMSTCHRTCPMESNCIARFRSIRCKRSCATPHSWSAMAAQVR